MLMATQVYFEFWHIATIDILCCVRSLLTKYSVALDSYVWFPNFLLNRFDAGCDTIVWLTITICKTYNVITFNCIALLESRGINDQVSL